MTTTSSESTEAAGRASNNELRLKCLAKVIWVHFMPLWCEQAITVALFFLNRWRGSSSSRAVWSSRSQDVGGLGDDLRPESVLALDLEQIKARNGYSLVINWQVNCGLRKLGTDGSIKLEVLLFFVTPRRTKSSRVVPHRVKYSIDLAMAFVCQDKGKLFFVISWQTMIAPSIPPRGCCSINATQCNGFCASHFYGSIIIICIFERLQFLKDLKLRAKNWAAF